MVKRVYDLLLAGLGLAVVLPLLVALGLVVKLSDGGPVLFRQRRVGFQGRPFYILKFRTMRPDAQSRGPSVTRRQDPRITPVGRVLRQTKLDELPQLWNVLLGDMSLVGPRPEVPCYVARYTREQRRVLELRPGITDLATLRYRNEEQILEGATDVEYRYVQEILPRKIELNLAYARFANLWEDTKVILRTVLPVIPFKLRVEKFGAQPGFC